MKTNFKATRMYYRQEMMNGTWINSVIKEELAETLISGISEYIRENIDDLLSTNRIDGEHVSYSASISLLQEDPHNETKSDIG